MNVQVLGKLDIKMCLSNCMTESISKAAVWIRKNGMYSSLLLNMFLMLLLSDDIEI